MRDIHTIVIHHTAVNVTLAQLHTSSLRRGYAAIPYHFVVMPDGSVHNTRPIERVGAHCRGHNAHSIGIAVMGNLDRHPPTPAQTQALVRLVRDLAQRYHATIHAHCELRPTRCPGRYLLPIVHAIRYTISGGTAHG